MWALSTLLSVCQALAIFFICWVSDPLALRLLHDWR